MVKHKLSKQKNKFGEGTLLGLAVVIYLALAGFILLTSCSEELNNAESPPKMPIQNFNNVETRPKAAIIDQLYSLQPDQTFSDHIKMKLETAGFQVDAYRGDEITVDFYKELPTYGYKLIIFRVHSWIFTNREKSINETCLFTNEPYSSEVHISEQITNQLLTANMSERHPLVFVVNARFVTNSMKGEFAGTVILMMGCMALHVDDLSQAFLDRGASAYIGWDSLLNLYYVDNATMILIEELCFKQITLESAIAETMREAGPDPNYGAVLQCYPPGIGSQTLWQLMQYDLPSLKRAQ